MLDQRGIELRRQMRQADFDVFADLSGDDNPIHVDEAFAQTTRFEKTVAHGMYLFSIITELQRQLIGEGAQVRETALMFPAPARAGDEIVFRGDLSHEEGVQRIRMTARRTVDDEIVCRYTATVGGGDAR